MAKNNKRGLGKGLSALIPTDTENFIMDTPIPKEKAKADHGKMVEEIPISKIIRGKEQSRMIFNEEKIEELAASIRTHGVLQPLVVRKAEKGYELIAGERRLRAGKAAGLKKLPVIVMEADDGLVAELGLIENLQREDLSPLEEAEAFRHMMDSFHYTQETLGDALGKSRSYIGNSLRLLHLSDAEKIFLKQGDITAGHCRALLSVKEPEGRGFLLDEIVNKGLSVRQAEDFAKRINDAAEKQPIKKKKTPTATTPFYREMENRMRHQFGTKVKIKSTSYGGCIEIDFYNNDDLERILNMVIEEEASLAEGLSKKE